MFWVILAVIILFAYISTKDSSNTKKSSHYKNSPQPSSQQAVNLEDIIYHRKKPSGRPAIWYDMGESITVRGHIINNGLIYVGEVLPDQTEYSNDACLINPSLPITNALPHEHGEKMGYWPDYESMPQECRGAFLKWLADGRSDPNACIGYVFIFFYGLERRLFVDGAKSELPSIERDVIIGEVNRLLNIYGNNRSFHRYASNFLATEWSMYQSGKPAPAYINFEERRFSWPFRVLLSRHVTSGNRITANMARQWLIHRQELPTKTTVRRCAKEFKELFAIRYKEKFGDGISVKPNKTLLKFEYTPASPSIEPKVITSNIPDPFILKGPINKLLPLAEKCIEDLDSYSRYLGRKKAQADPLVAITLLPTELAGQSCEITNIKKNLEGRCTASPVLIPTVELIELTQTETPSQIYKKDAENLASIVEAAGFGIIPDVRYYGVKPDIDANIVIFPKGHGLDFAPSKEFRITCTIIRLGAMVSQIDEDISPDEEKLLSDLIQNNRQLTQIEKDSLAAYLYWCLRTPQKASGLKNKLAALSSIEKTAISHILISVANADGRIAPEEIKQLEKLYTTLGLDKSQVISDLHTMASSTDDSPITVEKQSPGTSYSIPKVPTQKQTDQFNLNDELIKIREAETRQVKNVLEDIFVSQTDMPDESAPENEIIIAASKPLELLDQQHKDLFNHVITKDQWDRNTLHAKCNELGLMFDGAIEILNEWAFDQASAPLIDDGVPVFVDIDLAKEILNA